MGSASARTRGLRPAVGWALAAALLLAPGARAELISVDHPSPIFGQVTLDTETGLYWLDPTETTGSSYADIVAGAGGFYPDGWRHATYQEACSLFERTLVSQFDPPEPCPSGTTDFPIIVTRASVTAWLAIFGDTGFSLPPDWSGTRAMVEAAGATLLVGTVLDSAFEPVYIVNAAPVGHTVDTEDPTVGHFLVRDTDPFPPAVPSAGLLGRAILIASLALPGAGCARRLGGRRGGGARGDARCARSNA